METAIGYNFTDSKKLGRGFSVCFPCFKNRSLYSSQFAQKNEAMVWIKQL